MSTPFFYQPDQLRALSETILQMARDIGATDAFAEVSESSGLSVSVRMGELETIEQNRDKGASVTVYQGQRRGHATTSDLGELALRDAVAKAFDIARFTAEDPYAGLPDPAMVVQNPQPIDSYRPWEISAEAATEIALACESAARKTSPMVRNSEGAAVNASHGQFHSAHTRGFSGGYAYSRHGFWAAPIAQKGELMQRDSWSTSHRDPAQLASPEAVGRYAAERALSRLGARPIPTQTLPVLFDAPLAAGLVGALVHALSGSALYRKASFLNDSLGQQILPSHIDLLEDPSIPLALGSCPFDEEGVRTQRRSVISAGVVEGYFLSTYSARKMGMSSTGNAGGSHNLSLTSRLTGREDDLKAMLRQLHRGLFVTELMGQGVNGLTGDYSRGAFGYWVDNGEIQFPVEEVTIAGNLRQMFQGIVALGADAYTRGSKTVGSILIDQMTLAGN